MGWPARRTITKSSSSNNVRATKRAGCLAQRQQRHVQRALIEFTERRIELPDEIAHAEVDARRIAPQLRQQRRQQYRGHRIRRADHEAPHGAARIERLARSP